MTQITTYIGSSNHGFAQYAQDEIRKLFPLTKFTLLVPTEVFIRSALGYGRSNNANQRAGTHFS